MSAPLFRICTTQSSTFLRLFQAIEGVVADCSVVVSPTGLSIDCIDPTMAAMLKVNLEADKFEYFHCPVHQQFGIRSTALRKALEPPEKDVKLTLEMLADKRDVFTLRKENTVTGEVAEFTLFSLDYDQELLALPKIQYPNRLRFSCQWLSGHLRRAAEWGDTIEFVIPPDLNRLRLEVRGDIADLVVYEVRGAAATATVVSAPPAVEDDGGEEDAGEPKGPTKRPRPTGGEDGDAKRRRAASETLVVAPPVQETVFGKTVKNGYSLRYLNLISKAFRLCDFVDVGLQQDFPLLLTFDVHQLGKVVFVVAPKIQDE